MTLARFMELAGMTEEALAALVGVTQPAVSKWKHGRAIPRPAQMAKIVAATEGAVTPADFFHGEAA
ncbi:helix-turn-helix domain-containing protein [Paramagnetospirillum magneticum]|uniref:HTH cro/C1-type domain-containing protein n=1 Tax=Paramagnetospirillum magneticum (strain ATCC 700264 / AMB-1) TaxID=342108 RepID=Q2W5Y9_PARM1|nr:helix-turn-helix transcriptional regulator [Paramagnetospirillum magneticum]BAE50736.1 hypothetical protein amb1932 [Paramagnetospirillum magneticum AMB-1]